MITYDELRELVLQDDTLAQSEDDLEQTGEGMLIRGIGSPEGTDGDYAPDLLITIDGEELVLRDRVSTTEAWGEPSRFNNYDDLVSWAYTL